MVRHVLLGRTHTDSRGAALTRILLGLLGLLGLLAVVATACGTTPVKVADAVIIGATLPLTGADAAQAAAMKRGYERAVANANAAGGIRIGQASLGVRLDLRDDTSDTAALETLAQALVDAGAHVILATPRAVRAVAEADVTERAGAILIGNAIDHPGLPGTRMAWMHVLPTTTTNAETRAFDVASTALRAIARAGSLDQWLIREALGEK